jgi:hypothetical protein
MEGGEGVRMGYCADRVKRGGVFVRGR